MGDLTNFKWYPRNGLSTVIQTSEKGWTLNGICFGT